MMQPNPIMLFVVTLAGVSLVVGFIWLVGYLSTAGAAAVGGADLSPERLGKSARQLAGRAAAGGVRQVRAVREPAARQVNAALPRSARLNAENRPGSGVQPFAESSDLNATTDSAPAENTGLIDGAPAPDATPASDLAAYVQAAILPTTLDEMRALGYALMLYAQRPNKQRAIETAFGCTKGAGDEWKRASELFDLAITEQGRELVKKPAAPPVNAPPAPPPVNGTRRGATTRRPRRRPAR